MKAIYHPEYIALIEKLIVQRKTLNLTQAELAQKFNKPQSYVAKIEGCERKLDIIEFVKWSKELGLVASQLIASIDLE